MSNHTSTNSRGKQAELAFAAIFAEHLPDAQVLNDLHPQPKTALALVKTPEEVDWEEGIDFWLYHKNIGWIGADITIDSDPERLSVKRGKARKSGAYLVRLELGILLRAARGCHHDLETVIAVLIDVFSEELAARRSSPSPIHELTRKVVS